MRNHEMDNQIPCIIENGIVYGVKDIYRIVRDMGHVKYLELVNNETVTTGDGYIMSVVVNPQSATVIANKRLYLNVSGFDYLKIQTLSDGTVYFDLIHPARILRLIPTADAPGEEMPDDKMDRFEELAQLEQEEEDFAEIQLDDDDDLMDGE